MVSTTAGSSASRPRTNRRSWWARSSSSHGMARRSFRSSRGRLRITSASTNTRRRRCVSRCQTTPHRRRFSCPRCRIPRRPLRTPPRHGSTVFTRARQLDKGLVVAVFALALYRLATLYSAGQTDVPTFVATIWHRQLIWLGVGLAVAFLTFRTSPRMLEWATPWVYAIAIFLLLLTLVIGSGAGTAAGTKSWITVGGHRLGQPAELAKIAAVLMLARWLAALREPPTTLRQLILPLVIAGGPFALVVLQHDLGSAIVFVAIVFFLLFLAGT